MSKDYIYQALMKWVELTGVDPHSKRWTFGDWDIKRCHNHLKESQELDPSGITTAMLLGSILSNRMRDETFSVDEVLHCPGKFDKVVKCARELEQLLQRQEIRVQIEGMKEALVEALKHYEFDTKKVVKLSRDEYSLGFIRRDAFKAITKLQEYQFMQGEEKKVGAKYNPYVYEFWNVNSLLNLAVMHPEDGISLCLIRDPIALHSFFAFVVKNGHSVTVLTDREEWVHPREKFMSRRPDRRLEERMFKFRFPYQLLDIKRTSDGKRLYVKEREGLVPYQKEAIQLKKIRDLDPDQVVWLVMMFDLMKERYWVKGHRTKELAYTGEMLKVPGVLVDSVKLPAVRSLYKPLDLPTLHSGDVGTDKVLDQWQCEPTKANQWMEDRYGAQVPDEILNRVALPQPEEEESFFDQVDREREEERNPLKRVERLEESLSFVESFDPTDFGTAKEMQKDRVWYARYNKARMLEVLAEREYEEKKDEVINWYREKVRENIEALIQAVGRGEFVVATQTQHPKQTFDRSYEQEKNIIKVVDQDGKKNIYGCMLLGDRFHTVFLHGGRFGRYEYCCYRCKKSRGRMVVRFRPATPRALAALTGVAVEEMPVFLQNWKVEDPYGGNPILQRLDPLDWKVENPWKQIDFHVTFMFCKRCLNVLQRKYRESF